MSTLAQNPLVARLHSNRGLIFPAAVMGMLLVFLVPLPTALLDLLLVVNLTVSVMVLVTAIYVKSPLEFAVLPSLLLAVTIFRLVLNVATTRLILTVGDRASTPEAAMGAAGEMVEAFSQFVTAGNLTVGVVIFLIIFVIQFVVITKGSTRIGEVAARFTLDAMPGKQMAIDADLNAGAIDDKEARRRREDVTREADFYGAMDGASKFVRGDAIAGIIITAVNVLGGLFVGAVQLGWPLGQTAATFTQLTIGDGLVSQLPALVVSLGAGLLVTRSSSRNDVGNEVISQLFSKPQPLYVAAGFLALMSVTGLPMLPMMTLALCCGGLALVLGRNQKAALALAERGERERVEAEPAEPEKVEKALAVDAMELLVGVGNIRIVDTTQGGDLLDRISLLRRQIAVELGVVVPPIRIRDDAQLDPNDYRIVIRGQTVARGEVYPDQYLAMDAGSAAGEIVGAIGTTEPAFGLPAYWITEPQRPEAELLNYTVVEASAVLATHLTEVLKRHAHELLTRQEVHNLITNLKERAPALVDEVVPAVVKYGELQKVLQNLLRERVPVRDLETILETLGDYAGRTKDLDVLTEFTRNALARTICKQHVDESGKLWCVTLDPALEDLISGHVQRSEGGGLSNTMPPNTQQQIQSRAADKVSELTAAGRSGVILCSPAVRSSVRKLIEPALPTVAVLAYNEVVPDVEVEAVGMVGLGG